MDICNGHHQYGVFGLNLTCLSQIVRYWDPCLFTCGAVFEFFQYPSACGPYRLSGIRDLTAGYDNTKPDNKPILPVSKSSQMITFYFENGCVATLRTSGTEPKIKYYTELACKPGDKPSSYDRGSLACESSKGTGRHRRVPGAIARV
ncbi:Phosphoglucomutase-2 [Desmophyllum pertusum]|uniref:Phosphoglucomutase-2 n=1 Tax=Desmophyllum pertusum TaxID=174260 RepID=A0A9X0CGP4_9CNID|nr:Phosphoglucomutase-2 [Desmophyllum pertusum]